MRYLYLIRLKKHDGHVQRNLQAVSKKQNKNQGTSVSLNINEESLFDRKNLC